LILATLSLLFCPAFPVENPGSRSEQSAQFVGHMEESASTKTGSSASLPDAPLPKADASKDSEAITPGIIASAGPLMKTPVKPAGHGSYETERERKVWYGLMAAGHSAAIFDAYSTRRAISGDYGVESDPFIRPFGHSNAIYLATQVSPAVLDYVGHRMMTSEHQWMRRIWWLPQVAGTSFSMGAGIHNYRLAP
jgi:hypothetical protein